ncbi:phytanoyl-CoA dioxygenase family protein [Kitasatospora aureofaciens]|uniref:phytanoyl-CoA dioxygenase family protein n=1 Tax=Kitasatospora aureofaciens TaxID=1894 RepID=UPI001D1FCED4|nr:phytanoyl-CoA dioxygenase family protein [Kitasatospora aureofaciens]HJD80229.1 phytanoyl-CoA dioxygenase family protein [Kitasatospora aureofaciens]
MALTAAEKHAFMRDGLLVRRGAVAANQIARARDLVTGWYRESMNPALINSYTQRTFAPELGSHPDLLALFADSPAAELAQDLLGNLRPVSTVQLQIRIPDDQLEQDQPDKAMHVDGVACPHLDPDELRTFSLLVGVVLSDITDPQAGALRYQPGGHLAMAEWFRTQWSLGITEQVPPDIDAHAGTPFLGRPGDLLLMHHLVPHAVGRNLGPEPRIMAYFRVEHPDHASRRLQALQDPWLDYRGLPQAA